MTIKNLPEPLYLQLKRSAERHRRSINSEAIVCLERALHQEQPDPDALLARVRMLRDRAAHVFVTDSEIRATRGDDSRP